MGWLLQVPVGLLFSPGPVGLGKGSRTVCLMCVPMVPEPSEAEGVL